MRSRPGWLNSGSRRSPADPPNSPSASRTSRRPGGTSSPRPGSRLNSAMKIELDVHAHLIGADGAALAQFEGVAWDAASQKLVVDGHSIGLKALFRPAELIGWMDDNAVERAWISAPPPVYRPELAAAEAGRWASALNDQLDTIAQQYPSRLSPLYHLTVEHPEVALSLVRDKIS